MHQTPLLPHRDKDTTTTSFQSIIEPTNPAQTSPTIYRLSFSHTQNTFSDGCTECAEPGVGSGSHRIISSLLHCHQHAPPRSSVRSWGTWRSAIRAHAAPLVCLWKNGFAAGAAKGCGVYIRLYRICAQSNPIERTMHWHPVMTSTQSSATSTPRHDIRYDI
jgi:hypothetical protein